MAHEQRQLRRGRTRDYTIPVRLNQIVGEMRVAQRRVLQQLVSITSARRYLLALIVVIIVSMKVEQINCDNQLDPGAALPGKLTPVKSQFGAKPTQQATSAIDVANASKKNREKLLTRLSENIERQHLKMPFSFAVGSLQQRPSKFDSGEETLHTATSSTSSAKKSTASEDVLKDIMRLHEQPAAVSTRQSLHYASEPHLASGESPKTQLPEWIKPSSRNKVVAQLLSYIVSPLLGAEKLSTDSQTTVISRILPNVSLPLLLRPSSSSSSRPFTGRSNSGDTQSSASSPVTPAAPSLQKPFLALPNWMKSGRQSAYSTRPSTMFGDDTSGWMMLSSSSPSSPSSSSSSPPSDQGDLIADSANSQVHHAAAVADAPVRRPQLSSRQNRGNKELPSEAIGHEEATAKRGSALRPPLVGRWLKNNANHMAQNYLQDSFRGLLTLSQLPILPAGPVSTAPSVLEPRPAVQQRRRGADKPQLATSGSVPSTGSAPPSATTSNDNKRPDRRAKALEDLYRYAYILGTSMVGRKRDPLKALSTKARPLVGGSLPPTKQKGQFFTQRSINQLAADNRRQIINFAKAIQQALLAVSSPQVGAKQQAANPRGVMWDMATDPTLVVTLMHLVERASVALPLGFLLMPIVHLIRNPFNGLNLGRVLPPRALHRSVEHELLARRLDAVDKVLSRALRPSHRESFMGKK